MSGALDAIVGIRLLKLLSTPIEKTKAFTLGVIDKNGKKLRNPTSSERQYYTFLNRFAFKVQYALSRSPDFQSRRLLSFAAAMAMLKEHDEKDDVVEIMSLLELHMLDESVQLQARLLERKMLSFSSFNMEEMNGVGGGAVAGIGVGPQGEPGVDPRLMPLGRRKKKKDARTK